MQRTWIGLGASLGLLITTSNGCGGASSEIGPPGKDGGIGDPEPAPSPDCHRVTCVDVTCGAGFEKRSLPEECCPSCVPVASACAGTASSCTTLVGCPEGNERVEYAPGCCACRLDACAKTKCTDAKTCPAGKHLELAGCCAECVDDGQCNPGAALCTSFECPSGFNPKSGASDRAGCCSSCAADCAAARQNFEKWLEDRIATLGALACQNDGDCVVAGLDNDCARSCGRAIGRAFQATLHAEAATYASAHCSQCPPQELFCPPVVLAAKCDGKKCKLSPGL